MADIDTMLEEVKRLDAEATTADAWYQWTLERDENPTRYNALGPNTYTQDAADDDAALIAYYRTAAPLLAAEVERLRAEVERLTRDRDRIAGYVRAARRLSRDAHTHLLEERPEETARAIYRVICALASAEKEGDDQ